ncbi:hypothetical protein QWZ16_21740 [Vibrio ostreicida]|uniref:DUF3265 domain-containing protein n=1 Tax=Vibrio ostreicida TaxID=526588 RepID=A0ABT8BYI8_9VIBR|nr:hypothetical protein [Vibrio ostreicida]MDN3612221.1 hypothetical protein [Vibrio ostreicida]
MFLMMHAGLCFVDESWSDSIELIVKTPLSANSDTLLAHGLAGCAIALKKLHHFLPLAVFFQLNCK